MNNLLGCRPPPLFNDTAESMDARVSDAEHIADGGAAMTAYAHLQHVEPEPDEREALSQGLLRLMRISRVITHCWET